MSDRETDLINLTKEEMKKELCSIDLSDNKTCVVINANKLTNADVHDRIPLLVLITMAAVGGVSVYAGNVFSGFIAVVWVYLFNVFYNHFGLYPDPLINPHSNKNFVVRSASFGVNNQVFALYCNSSVRASISQILIWGISYIDYVLYGLRDKIAILYNIEFKLGRPAELEFLATAVMLLAVVLAFNVRDVIRIAVINKRFGYGFSCSDAIFYVVSLLSMFLTYGMCRFSLSVVVGLLEILWFATYIVWFAYFWRTFRSLKHDIAWDEPDEVYFKILNQDGSVFKDHVRVETLSLSKDGKVLIFDHDSNDVIRKNPTALSKIILHDHETTTEWVFNTANHSWV